MQEERKEGREGSAELEGRRTAERRGGENERFSAALPPPPSPLSSSYFAGAFADADHGSQMAIAKFSDCMHLALRA